VLIREVSLKKPLLAKIEKYGEISQFMLPKKEKKNDFSAFALADAAMVRDRKTAWVEFEKSRRKGEAMEALHGMLFWAFKTLTAVATLPKADALASGIKANSYTSGLRGMEKYKPAEICTRLDDLKDMYHRAHRGECDLEYSLEQFLLQL
jgi:DNA polymerase III delta subunit